MLTNDKAICSKEYWDGIYTNKRDNATVDSSNGIRPKQTFDRFDIVVKHVDGTKVLDIGSGHGHICKRIKALNKNWIVIASDQSQEARKVAKYEPYIIADAYKLPFTGRFFDTVICTQALEYLENQDAFLKEVSRIGKKFICTIPLGLMPKWSQLFEYNETDFCAWISRYGAIEVKENYGEILLVKLKFYD